MQIINTTFCLIVEVIYGHYMKIDNVINSELVKTSNRKMNIVYKLVVYSKLQFIILLIKCFLKYPDSFLKI